MVMQKRLLSLVLTLALVLSLGAGSLAVEQGQSGDIIILSTNDVHNGVNDNIGYAGLAAYKARMEAIVGAGNVTLVDAGDSIQGAAIGVLSKGGYLIDIMDYVGYDIAIPGNHEFDFGMARFLELAGSSSFPYVSSNFIDLKTNLPVFDAYKIIDYGQLSIAYVGITTPETFSKSTPAYFQDGSGKYIYGFCEDPTGQKLYTQVQNAIDAASAEGADYVIAVAHLGVDPSSSPWTSAEVVANTTGLDAIIDGHSHSVVDGALLTDRDGNGVPCVQTGTKFQNIGKIVVKADGSLSAGLVTPGEITETDADTQAFIDSITAQYEDSLKQVVARSDYLLTTEYPDTGLRAVRTDETNLGDLCADAYRSVLGADIGFINGGGLRANIKAGDVTIGDIMAVHPFGNQVCMVEITGRQLLDALEHGARALPYETGGFLHVSGVSYAIDTTVPSSVQVNDQQEFQSVAGPRRVKDVMVNGQPVNPEKTYTLASISYTLKDSGDGYTMFKDCKILLDDVMLDSQVLITYITEKLGGVVGGEYSNPRGQGRVTVYAPFSDVRTVDWFYGSVKYVKDNGLMTGVTATSFEPGAELTRGMLVTVLYRADGAEAEPGEAFGDVPADAWYAEAVAWAAENGIVVGDGGLFRPGAPISRQEMATVIYRYYDYLGEDLELADLEYSDKGNIDFWAQDAVAFCSKAGIMTGVGGNMFDPTGTSNRAEGATVLSRITLPDAA